MTHNDINHTCPGVVGIEVLIVYKDRSDTKDNLMKLINELKDIDNIKLEEFPEYRLYISQIEEFFDKKIRKNVKDDDEDKKTMSKTMIQNYIKDGLLMPPDGKCYSRSHVILLVLIYNLKSILSIKDIKRLLAPIMMMVEEQDEDNTSGYLEQIYEAYFKIKDRAIDNFSKVLLEIEPYIQDNTDILDLPDNIKDFVGAFMEILILVTYAKMMKRVAEGMINNLFANDCGLK